MPVETLSEPTITQVSFGILISGRLFAQKLSIEATVDDLAQVLATCSPQFTFRLHLFRDIVVQGGSDC